MELQLAHRSIFNSLELAARTGELINTNRKNRKLGKTTALVEFARLNDYTILTPNSGVAKLINKYFGYKKVKSIKSYTLDALPGVVIEEGCTSEDIQSIKNQGINIITGFLFDDTVFNYSIDYKK